MPARDISTKKSPQKIRGPLPSSQETSYHKRLRLLLQEHRKCRKEWTELVYRGLVQRSRACVELWSSLESGLTYISTHLDNHSACRTGLAHTQSEKLSKQVVTIEAVKQSIVKLVGTMLQLCDRSESLVAEASQTRGFEFAFVEPLWVTWPLSKFSDELTSLTAQYQASLILVHQLIERLTLFPKFLEEDGEKAELGVAANEIQACLTLLAVQPHISSKTGNGPDAWEELLQEEVSEWE